MNIPSGTTTAVFFVISIPCIFIISVMITALMQSIGEQLAKQRSDKLADLYMEHEILQQIIESKKAIMSMDKSMRLN